MESYKILVCGDIGGNFQQLYKRVATVNKSNGPFHLLLCVGAFFEPFSASHDSNQSEQNQNDQDQDGEQNKISFPKELQSYKDDKEVIPIPTYFIAYTPTDYKYIEKFSNENGEICKNLTYLGKSGIKDLMGLNVAYLSGKVDYPIKEESNDSMTIIKTDIEKLINDSKDKKIDIFLSNQWARGVLNNVQSGIPTFLKTPYKIGMDSIKEVVQSTNPAYHFSKNSFYFQRPPYLNHSNETKVTRFLSLAPVYNEKKEKYLFAMNYQPAKEVTTNDATLNPFERRQNNNDNSEQHTQKKQRNTEETTTNFFFGNNVNTEQDNQQENKNQRKRQHGDNNNQQNRHHERHQKKFQMHQQKPKPQQQNCWFCLSSPDVDSHLVVTIANDCYLAFPKGGVVDHHLLIVFIEHKANYISLDQSEKDDINKMINILREFFDKRGQDIVVFERNSFLKGAIAHGHLQVIPIPKSLSSKVKSKFIEHSTENNMEFKELPENDNALNDKYFLLILPNGEKLYSTLPQKSDYQFGRKVMVDLLGTPEKLNWKDCMVSKEEEMNQTASFRDEFQPFYDEKNPSNDDDD
ncbi:hypothetical protein DICPUDRAFT_87565 [Dictyostelium purpureum]|uniref:Cwf19-like C-terminal domain-containing protein n=1 Tax=Dictyostelium purpureum TaxID=5786 RepID=F0ZIY6_DICPU|nr:uncharacterized protein DICPUDRAFT_87565 [Dictyostelium purpureum]EGC36123.1 hypothetical protein DICPUDRAFT_87565 [Dictyostelium purpureum]|eukprot:XP_003287380.1 hypothetical protein DICPUDRAFT_87565 [Dictyostelium purpureum]